VPRRGRTPDQALCLVREPADAAEVRILPVLGSTLALAAVVGGGLALHPELLAGSATPATTAAAVTTTSTNPADRRTVVSGMNPVTGANAPGYTFDSSLLGSPWVPGPSVELPELDFTAPAPGAGAKVSTSTRSQQFGHTAQWTAKPQVDGPVRRVVKTVAPDGYIVVPNEAGNLHLLCGPGSDSYYIDSHQGEWRVYRVDGGPSYDVSYRFVQYDRSPISLQKACQ
jgi:hypothetical protein